MNLKEDPRLSLRDKESRFADMPQLARNQPSRQAKIDLRVATVIHTRERSQEGPKWIWEKEDHRGPAYQGSYSLREMWWVSGSLWVANLKPAEIDGRYCQRYVAGRR
jgi:hypothetical protein